MAEIILVALLRAPCCLPMVGILRVRGARDQKQGERDRGRRHHCGARKNSFVFTFAFFLLTESVHVLTPYSICVLWFACVARWKRPSDARAV